MRCVRLAPWGALLLLACGDGSIGGSIDAGSPPDGPFVTPPGLVSLEVLPGDITLEIDGSTPATQTYQAIGHFQDSHTEDLTDRVVFLIDNIGLGTFDGNEFTSGVDFGGRGRIRAFIGSVETFAYITLRIRQRYPDPQAPGLPSDPTAPFNGPPSAARNPDLVYPNDGVLLPPNLKKIEVHWLPGPAANTLFELSFQSATTDVKIYTMCVNPMNGGCIFLPEPKVWVWLAESNRGGAELTFTARATDAGGTGVGTSASRKMSFSQDDIDGAMYYWTTPKGEPDTDPSKAVIYRWDFASTTQTEPLRIVGSDRTGDHCVGCHALSPEGKRLFVTSEGSYDAFVLLLNLETNMPIVPWNTTDRVAFGSWEWPNGDRFVGTFADESEGSGKFRSYDLNIYNGSDGAFLETIDVGGSESSPSAHPDWSPPNGAKIAYTRIGMAQDADVGTTVRGFRASLRLVERQGSGWSSPVTITTAAQGQATYYPAFSPDGALLLYNRSTCASGSDGDDCNMYDDPTASLWVIEPQAGATPVRLTLADQPGTSDPGTYVQNSFPKWTPFVFRRTGETGDRLFWFTFSSDRRYGLRTPDPGEALIWMAGIDPDAALRGEDGSFTAFCLPFQDIARDNHTAQWAKKAVLIP